MKKIIYTLLVLFGASQVQAQVGIGTNNPDNSAMLEVKTTERGVLFPRMTSAQRTGIASPANGLYVFDTNTNSLWYYNGTLWINTIAEASLGDVKSGFQTADHSGWIILDGRAVNTLSANQQAVSISLGFTTNLPDASSAYLVQNGSGMGAVAGANTTTLTQANLPNVTFNGTAANAGNHSHTTDPAPVNTSTSGNHNHSGTTNTTGNHVHNMTFQRNQQDHGITGKIGDNGEYGDVASSGSMQAAGNHSHSVTTDTQGNHTHSVDIPSTTSSTNGSHIHTVTVSSGGSATPINITPRSLSVNMFVYLG